MSHCAKLPLRCSLVVVVAAQLTLWLSREDMRRLGASLTFSHKCPLMDVRSRGLCLHETCQRSLWALWKSPRFDRLVGSSIMELVYGSLYRS